MKTISNKFQKYVFYGTLVFLMLFNCSANSQTRTSANNSTNIETILKLLNSEIDATSAYQIRKNNVYFFIQNQDISMSIRETPPKYSANAPSYNIPDVTSRQPVFSYDASTETIVLTIQFNTRIHPIIIYNNGCFTKREDRMIKSKWFQPEKIEVSFISEIVNGETSLNFLDVKLVERPYPENLDDKTKHWNAKINGDIKNGTIKMFKSDEMKTLLKTILKNESEN